MMGLLLDHGNTNLFTFREQVPVMCRVVGSELMGMDGIAAGASIAQNALRMLGEEDSTYANGAVYDFMLSSERLGGDITVLAAMLRDALSVMEARSREEAAMLTNRMLRRLPGYLPGSCPHDVYSHVMCVGAALTSLLYGQPATRWMCLFVPIILCRAAVTLVHNCHMNRIGIVQTVTREVTAVLANQHRMLAHLRYAESLLEEVPIRCAQ